MEENKKLAIYFGGLGYHCDKPLLYYTRKLALEKDYMEFVNVNYNVTVKKVRGDSNAMRKAFSEVYAQAEKILAEVDFNQYEDILFVGKSIGTVVMAAYQEKKQVAFAHKKIKNIFLTPLEMTFEYGVTGGIAFSGTKDPWVNSDEIVRLCQKYGISLHQIEGVNHSLEGEDVFQNLMILQDVMKQCEVYL